MEKKKSQYLAEVRAGIKKKQDLKEQALARRKKEAHEKARRAAALIRSRCGGRVFLFGSLARNGGFFEYSDIDLAVSGLPREVNFWKLYADVLALAEPFHVDLVILEKAPVDLRQHIQQEGVEL